MAKKKETEPTPAPEFTGDLKTLLDFIVKRTTEHSAGGPATPAAPKKVTRPMEHVDIQVLKSKGLGGINTNIKRVIAHFLGAPEAEILGGAEAGASKSERDGRRATFPKIGGVCIVPLGKGHNYDTGKPVLTLGLCAKDAQIDVNGEDWDLCLKPSGFLGNHIATSDVRVATMDEINAFVTAWGEKPLPLIP